MVMVVKLRSQLDPGLVALALLNIMSFNNNLTALIQCWTSLETSMGAIARLKAFGQDTASEHSGHDEPPADWPDAGQISIRDLSAAYSMDLPNALVDLNITLHSGTKVGICGASGSGKSSLMATLFRMVEITKGNIEIDGIDICTLSRETVRRQLNAVPQQPVFLKGTVRQNMDPLNIATDEAIENALRDVGLWDVLTTAGGMTNIHSEIDLETALSHGQRQLFCLARAIVRPSPIVVLDEATASVDVETDAKVQQIIRRCFRGKTVIAIAHRLQTIMDFDVVVVMEQGRIVEQGNPQELLGREGGRFWKLWHA